MMSVSVREGRWTGGRRNRSAHVKARAGESVSEGVQEEHHSRLIRFSAIRVQLLIA